MGMASERDARGRRLVAVRECILNQNARDEGAAASAAMNLDVLRLCNKYEVGILQMPCPEIALSGFAREGPSGKSIRDALNTDEGRKCCGRISVGIADRLEEYVRKDYEVLAILGGGSRESWVRGAQRTLRPSGHFGCYDARAPGRAAQEKHRSALQWHSRL